MKIDPDARYTETHEWVRKEGDVYLYGITDHAQDSLSDIVYVELPEVGSQYSKGEIIGAIESVKAASDLYIPMDGEVMEVNEVLVDAPEIINSDPYREGWMVKFKASQPDQWEELLTPEDYEELEGE
jgi:glycine cleavage system H protein